MRQGSTSCEVCMVWRQGAQNFLTTPRNLSVSILGSQNCFGGWPPLNRPVRYFEDVASMHPGQPNGSIQLLLAFAICVRFFACNVSLRSDHMQICHGTLVGVTAFAVLLVCFARGVSRFYFPGALKDPEAIKLLPFMTICMLVVGVSLLQTHETQPYECTHWIKRCELPRERGAKNWSTKIELMYILLYIYKMNKSYIYIYICMSLSLSLFVYIYIYIYMHLDI